MEVLAFSGLIQFIFDQPALSPPPIYARFALTLYQNRHKKSGLVPAFLQLF